MTNLDKLVEQLENCTNDGMPCGGCPVFKECVELWDNHVSNHIRLSYFALFHYSQKFKALQDKKRILVWPGLTYRKLVVK